MPNLHMFWPRTDRCQSAFSGVVAVIFAVASFSVGPSSALAQTAAVTTSPPNIIVPNYNGQPAGPLGGLEGSAYVARASDPSAAWFNPAGLSLVTGTEITGSAGMFQTTSVTPKELASAGNSVQQVPDLVGFTFKAGNLTLGAAFVTTISWEQETDTEGIFTNDAGRQERFAYSADADLRRRVGSFSASFDRGRKWRFGAGLAYSYASIRSVQTASDRVADPAALRTLVVSSRWSGSTFQVLPVVGVQVDLSPTIRVGGVFRTPGLRLFRSGSMTLDGVQDSGSSSIGASLFDPEAQFQYKLPFEVAGGVAFVGQRAQLEFDVQGYSSIDQYAMISSPKSLLIYSDPGTGAPPAATTQPFPGLTTSARGMANFSLGGRVRLTESRPIELRFGVATDLSPVTSKDRVFDKIDLFPWTIGLSGSTGRFSYAAGLNYRSGTSEDIVVFNVLGGQPIETAVHIRTIGMIYSLAYRF
jgi:hypothetical protein